MQAVKPLNSYKYARQLLIEVSLLQNLCERDVQHILLQYDVFVCGSFVY